jgi:polar amino acid transport system substrate-binding protein
MRCLFHLLLIIGLVQLGACGREAPPADEPADEPVVSASEAAPTEEDATIPAGACQLTMGWDPWPPFHYTGFGGELTGFDVDLVRALAADTGCELDFERDSWAALLARVRDGNIDLVTGATMTPERQEFALFSEPVRREEFALFVRVGELGNWEAEDLRELMERGMRLGITEAYVYDDSVEEVLEDPAYADNVLRSRFGEANIGRLLDGDIDAFVEDVFAARTMIRRLGFEGAISRHRMKLGEGTDVRIMYSRSSVSSELVAGFDRRLAHLKESGDYDALRQRYLE